MTGNLSTIGNYVLMKTLGEGNFAKVKLAKHKITGQEVLLLIRILCDELYISHYVNLYKGGNQDHRQEQSGREKVVKVV